MIFDRYTVHRSNGKELLIMRKSILFGVLCAALLFGNYAVMRHISRAPWDADEIVVDQEHLKLETLKSSSENTDKLIVTEITEEERTVLEDIALRVRTSSDARVMQGNRKMTASETDRWVALSLGYDHGLRKPEQPMPLTPTEDTVWFDPETLQYDFPADEMTDEMLLEMTEFDAKINLLLKEFADKEAPVPGKDDLTEEAATLLAKQYIWKFYGADVETYDVFPSFCEPYTDITEYIWDFFFAPPNLDLLQAAGKDYMVYSVEIDARTGELLCVDATQGISNREKHPDSLSEEQMKACEWAAWEALQSFDETIGDCTCEGFYYAELLTDFVFVRFQDEEQHTYLILLRWPLLEANSYYYFEAPDKYDSRMETFHMSKVVVSG